MAKTVCTIYDRDRDVYLESLKLGPADLPAWAAGCFVEKRTLRGGLSAGVDVVKLGNGVLTLDVLPTRGMGLWRARVGELQLGWQSPVKGPVHPAFVPLWEPNGLGWLSGFDEWLCRCGLESNGGPVHDETGRLIYPLHGKIANTPAHRVEVIVDDAAGELAIRGAVDEARLYHQKLRLTSTIRLRVGEPEIRITDVVANLSAEPAELQLLYHINFGKPFLDPGSRVVAPVRAVVPQTARAAEGVSDWDVYGPEEPGYTEQVFFLDLLSNPQHQTEVLLRNAHGNHGVSLHFSQEMFPYFTVWKSTQHAADGYVTGLEPSLNLPNTRDFEARQGRVSRLGPHEERTFELRVEAHANADGVARSERRIGQLQTGTAVKIFRAPQPGWSAAAT